MQQSVELALKQADFSVKYKEEAEMIAEIKCLDTKSFPITVELLQHVSKCLGKNSMLLDRSPRSLTVSRQCILSWTGQGNWCLHGAQRKQTQGKLFFYTLLE